MPTDQDAKIWPDVLAHLRRAQPEVCRQWFEELVPLPVEGGHFPVRAASAMHRDYLQRHCLSAFNDAVGAVTGHILAVRFLGPGDPTPAAEAAGSSGLTPPPRSLTRATPDGLARRDALVLNPDNSFDNFVIGPSNRLAHAAARAVADRPGSAYNPLFIYGGVGLGKTHLLQAICLRLLARPAGLDLYYLSCDSFITQFVEAVQRSTTAEFRHKFRELDVLVIDDIHFLSQRESSQEEFFHTFNALYSMGRQVIVSSDAAPEDIPHLEARLVSRFKQGMVAQVDKPTFEMRVAIVKQKAALRGFDMPDDVAGHIASRISANIRELEGAITQLQARCDLDRRAPDLAMAREMMGDPVAKPAGELTIQTVIKVVTDFFSVRVTDLQSKRRHRSVTMPRQVCMYLARRHTRHSLEEIGGYFGGRDHTTVMHACQVVETRREQSAEFDQQVALLDQKLAADQNPSS